VLGTQELDIQCPDGNERQIIKDLDGNMARPKIRLATVCDPYAMIIREDNTLGLFIGEVERGKIRRKDMSPMGDKVGYCSFSVHDN
jgi:cleavage and polyadenylation specificity factor subunit 1